MTGQEIAMCLCFFEDRLEKAQAILAATQDSLANLRRLANPNDDGNGVTTAMTEYGEHQRGKP